MSARHTAIGHTRWYAVEAVEREESAFPGRYWHVASDPDGRIQCDVCPRYCRLNDGQRGLCFVRQRQGDGIVLTTYGRSSGFIIDPIEKKPLNHFFPGSSVLSFGTAGCNLACRFCQNWDISKSREMDTLASRATPDALAAACVEHGCASIAFTYNDPVIFLEYAVDTAKACRERGVHPVAVTAGYIAPEARAEFYSVMDAANVDLKAFTEDFYREQAKGQLAPVLDTLRYLAHETEVWFEITTLLIPGLNDGDDELNRECEWVAKNVSVDVPIHFSAYHPDFKMLDRPRTPASTLSRARQIARSHGLRYVYSGNVHDRDGDTTTCHECGAALIVRDWYDLHHFGLKSGRCPDCGAPCAGHFDETPGTWGRRQQRVMMY